MVQDEGAALFKKLEDDRGAPLTVLTPEVGGWVAWYPFRLL
jgi:hypothetical protein